MPAFYHQKRFLLAVRFARYLEQRLYGPLCRTEPASFGLTKSTRGNLYGFPGCFAWDCLRRASHFNRKPLWFPRVLCVGLFAPRFTLQPETFMVSPGALRGIVCAALHTPTGDSYGFPGCFACPEAFSLSADRACAVTAQWVPVVKFPPPGRRFAPGTIRTFQF